MKNTITSKAFEKMVERQARQIMTVNSSKVGVNRIIEQLIKRVENISDDNVILFKNQVPEIAFSNEENSAGYKHVTAGVWTIQILNNVPSVKLNNVQVWSNHTLSLEKAKKHVKKQAKKATSQSDKAYIGVEIENLELIDLDEWTVWCVLMDDTVVHIDDANIKWYSTMPHTRWYITETNSYSKAVDAIFQDDLDYDRVRWLGDADKGSAKCGVLLEGIIKA